MEQAVEEQQHRRTRVPTPVLVETIQQGQNGWTSATKDNASFGDVQDAEKWIRTNGQDGRQYRIVRLVALRKVKVENVRKAVLE